MILVRFNWDWGRMGVVEGLFVTEQDKLDAAIGMEVYFGEILGKHSDVYGILESQDFEIISMDEDAICNMFEDLDSVIIGYNPLDYIYEEEEDD